MTTNLDRDTMLAELRASHERVRGEPCYRCGRPAVGALHTWRDERVCPLPVCAIHDPLHRTLVLSPVLREGA